MIIAVISLYMIWAVVLSDLHVQAVLSPVVVSVDKEYIVIVSSIVIKVHTIHWLIDWIYLTVNIMDV